MERGGRCGRFLEIGAGVIVHVPSKLFIPASVVFGKANEEGWTLSGGT